MYIGLVHFSQQKKEQIRYVYQMPIYSETYSFSYYEMHAIMFANTVYYC